VVLYDGEYPIIHIKSDHIDRYVNPLHVGDNHRAYPRASGIRISHKVRLENMFSVWSRVCSSVSLPLAILTPESYAPIILQKRAKRLRKETGNPNIVSPSNLGNQAIKQALCYPLSMTFSNAVL
jgi:hypothetical protein